MPQNQFLVLVIKESQEQEMRVTFFKGRLKMCHFFWIQENFIFKKYIKIYFVNPEMLVHC
jgi:hypothetical protein